jgi:3-mercaptopropionate dioxygenase
MKYMPNTQLALPLQIFVEEVNRLMESVNDEAQLHTQIADAMHKLVAIDDWLDPVCAKPHPEYYQQYLLYADPDDRFSVVSFVWGPGQHTPVHDHTVWGVVGMLRGKELAQNFVIASDGTPQPDGESVTLTPGNVALVSPAIGDVHRVSNALADQVSISIHAYGGNIGKIKRHVFPEQGGEPKDFISGYANAS